MPVTFTLRPNLVAGSLALIAAGLLMASIAGQLFVRYHDFSRGKFIGPIFYVDAEQNLPTLFSVMLLSVSSLLLAMITMIEKRRGVPRVAHWAALSVGFMVMTVDEFTMLHEKFNKPTRALLGDGDLGMLYFSWVIPGIIGVVTLGLFFLRFWWNLPAPTRLRFAVACVLYLAGCIGMELVGGYYAEANGMRTMTYVMIATIEEGLELTGLILFIRALLMYVSEHYSGIRFQSTHEAT